MDAETRGTLQALFAGGAGGLLASPGLGIVGVTGVPRARGPWEVVASAEAPDLTGDELDFVALPDGTLVVDDDIPDGSAGPLADAVEEYLEPPYRAAALRRGGEVWAVAATGITVIELPDIDGESLEASRVLGTVTFSLDGEPGSAASEIRALLDRHDGDVAVTAERIDGSTWIAEIWPL